MSNKELYEVKGGVSKTFIVGGVGVILSFLIGIIDGYLRPLSCNK